MIITISWLKEHLQTKANEAKIIEIGATLIQSEQKSLNFE